MDTSNLPNRQITSAHVTFKKLIRLIANTSVTNGFIICMPERFDYGLVASIIV